LPSTSVWFRANEWINAAAFSGKLGYASPPKTDIDGRAAAGASRRPRKIPVEHLHQIVVVKALESQHSGGGVES